MRSIWKGAVSFGLVNVPVRVFSATQNHDIRFHQVHAKDGGRVRYRRTCTECGEEVAYADIAKGYESDDGNLVVLSDEDLAGLPLATGKEIDVVEFVGADEVDPLLLDKSYYLEPEAKAIKPYVLLREALDRTDRMAVVKVALRQRESLAVLRVRDDVIVLQTMLWPDEIRSPDFDVLDTDVALRDQEMAMASSLVESLTAPFDASQFEDEYSQAVKTLVETKLEGGDVRKVADTEDGDGRDAEVVDLLAALQRSVDAANSKGSSSGGPEASDTSEDSDADTKSPTRKTPAKKAPAMKEPAQKEPSKTAAKKAPARKTAAKKTPAKKAAARKSA
ncbi:MAG: Ku protein [Nocardioidaceae bacterium]|nr:Ku protein [Nocardioidaceae bacterium]